MKYYIATSLSRSQDHNLVRDALKEFGHTLSYDWTLHGSVKSVSLERLREVAVSELNGVLEADYLVVLLPGGTGTHLELGVGLGNNKRIFLHTEDPSLFDLGPQTNAFYHHPNLIRLCCPLAHLPAQIDAHLGSTSSPSYKGCLLKEIEKQENTAKKFGFYWENAQQLIEQIQNECKEVQEALEEANTFHLQEEVGDLIQAAISLAVFCKLDPRETLLKSIKKFQKRYDAVVQLSRGDGYETLHSQPFEILMHYWSRAKAITQP